MHSQQKAESDLLGVYRRTMMMVLMLSIFAVLGWGYFTNVEDIRAQGLALEHNRLVTTLPMIRSQWLSSGRPQKIRLEWQGLSGRAPGPDLSQGENQSDSQGGARVRHDDLVLMNPAGWPQIASLDALGCEALWSQLLGSSLRELKITVSYQVDIETCLFVAMDGSRLSYQTSAGEVSFWRVGDN